MLKLLLMIAVYYPLSVGLTFYQKWFIKVSASRGRGAPRGGVATLGL